MYSSMVEHSVQYSPENYFIIFQNGSEKKIFNPGSENRQNGGNFEGCSNSKSNNGTSLSSHFKKINKENEPIENIIRLKD